MDEKFIAALRAAGVNIEAALYRFSNNAALYERFLRKFPSDQSFARIGPALQEGNWQEAVSAAHALKGVSGNLGMDRLFHACTRTVDLLRGQDYDQAVASYPELELAYGQICQALDGELS